MPAIMLRKASGNSVCKRAVAPKTKVRKCLKGIIRAVRGIAANATNTTAAPTKLKCCRVSRNKSGPLVSPKNLWMQQMKVHLLHR